MSGVTVLGTCLRAIRSLPSVTASSTPPCVDFFGSPFRALGIDAPWLEAPGVMPLEGVPDADIPFELIDWEALARARKAGAHDAPHALLIFLELLRCIASPIAGVEGARLREGVCRPGRLPQEYFREDPDEPHDYMRATRELRRAFFLLYAHVLIRRLAHRHKTLVSAVFDLENADERMLRLRAILRKPTHLDGKRWKTLCTAAVLFAGSQTFRQCVLGASSHAGFPPLNVRGVGAPTRLSQALYEEEFGAAAEIALPMPLALILHLTLDDRSDRSTLALLPKFLHEHAHILWDEQRVERAASMLETDQHPWLTVRFTRHELWNGTTKPSSLYTNLASFCLALEVLLSQDLAPVEAPTQRPVENAMAPEEDAALQAQIAALGADIASNIATASSPRKKRPGTRFVTAAPEGDFEFSSDGIATLTFGSSNGASRPLICKAQESEAGPVPAGSILVPIPRHLVRGKLHLEFHLFRFEQSAGGQQWRMIALKADATDYFIVDEGALFCIELTEPALSAGSFYTQASMRLTFVPGETSELNLCCVIGVVEDGRMPERTG